MESCNTNAHDWWALQKWRSEINEKEKKKENWSLEKEKKKKQPKVVNITGVKIYE